MSEQTTQNMEQEEILEQEAEVVEETSTGADVLAEAVKAAVAAQDRTVLEQQGFGAHTGSGNCCRCAAGAAAGDDHIVMSAIPHGIGKSLDPGTVFVHPLDLTGRGVVQIIGNQDGGAAAEIAGQVVEGDGVGTLGQLHVTGDLPQPLVGGEAAQHVARLLPVHKDFKLTGIMGTEPVAGARPNPVMTVSGDVDGKGGVLHGDAGFVGGHEVAGTHQMDVLSVLFPAAVGGKIKGINPEFGMFGHRNPSFPHFITLITL